MALGRKWTSASEFYSYPSFEIISLIIIICAHILFPQHNLKAAFLKLIHIVEIISASELSVLLVLQVLLLLASFLAIGMDSIITAGN